MLYGNGQTKTVLYTTLQYLPRKDNNTRDKKIHRAYLTYPNHHYNGVWKSQACWIWLSPKPSLQRTPSPPRLPKPAFPFPAVAKSISVFTWHPGVIKKEDICNLPIVYSGALNRGPRELSQSWFRQVTHAPKLPWYFSLSRFPLSNIDLGRPCTETS